MPNEDLLKDAESLLSGGPRMQGTTRRGALKAALGVGYTSAAGPISAQNAIRTSAIGLDAGPIRYEVNGFVVPAYRAAPARKTGLPVVLVVQEIYGVHEYIADTARRFARAGYLAIAPDLYARQGDPSRYTEMSRLLAELVAKVPDAQVMSDLDGAMKWAAAHGGDVGKAGITGFCWGGRITWLYAAQRPIRAGVAWYGRLVGSSSALTPRHPVDVAAELQAPVLGLYGGADPGIPPDTVDRMEAALAAGSPAAQASRIVVYPDAPHAFHADYRSTYRQGAAEDGWRRALEWLRTHGVA